MHRRALDDPELDLQQVGNGITVYFFSFLKYSGCWLRYWDPYFR